MQIIATNYLRNDVQIPEIQTGLLPVYYQLFQFDKENPFYNVEWQLSQMQKCIGKKDYLKT